MSETRFSVIAAPMAEAQLALQEIKSLYQQYIEPKIEKSTHIVVLGGDGFMLETLHNYMSLNIPFFGMNCGTVGFLMNKYELRSLPKRLKQATGVMLHPLAMTTVDQDGKKHQALAINEVSLLRQTRQVAKISVIIDGVTRLPELSCDGILLSTPAGSTAYNLSAHGPILPLGSPVLALTPISAFRPRRWRGAILKHNAVVELKILEHTKRPVSAVADSVEVRNVLEVQIYEDRQLHIKILFDADRSLEERILNEQFLY
ncbi:MAG: NAD kinase [Alphaproteobacteria bacterium]|nr:NAD kinase [Alphaproteobacteria bacterium]